jgi:hypothetical protein
MIRWPAFPAKRGWAGPIPRPPRRVAMVVQSGPGASETLCPACRRPHDQYPFSVMPFPSHTLPASQGNEPPGPPRGMKSSGPLCVPFVPHRCVTLRLP